MIKFLHMSDVHLGCRRYNIDERTKDFFRSWFDVINNHALPNEVDFVLIAGDFFDRRNIDPQTMNHALAGLQLLRDAGIPVVAIEGNHDRRDAVSDYSWMRSFSQAGFFILLEPARAAESDDSALPWEMVPWDEETRTGSYVDIKGARIFGTHWYGTSANAAMPMLAERSARGARRGTLPHPAAAHRRRGAAQPTHPGALGREAEGAAHARRLRRARPHAQKV